MERGYGGPYVQDKYGGISYSNLDCKIEDGTTFWRCEDETYQENKKANANSKYFMVSTTGERNMISDFKYIVELFVQNQNFDMYESFGKLKANNIHGFCS